MASCSPFPCSLESGLAFLSSLTSCGKKEKTCMHSALRTTKFYSQFLQFGKLVSSIHFFLCFRLYDQPHALGSRLPCDVCSTRSMLHPWMVPCLDRVSTCAIDVDMWKVPAVWQFVCHVCMPARMVRPHEMIHSEEALLRPESNI